MEQKLAGGCVWTFEQFEPDGRLVSSRTVHNLMPEEGRNYVIGAAIAAGKPMKATPESIRPITTADYPAPAKRPANSRLDTHKFRTTFGLELPHWQHGLDHILQQIL